MSAPRPIKKVLIANRGEIAVRVIRACHEAGIRTVAVYSEADRISMPVRMAHEAYLIGGAAPGDSYLRTDRILEAVEKSGADAIHPGYGFLSENAAFVRELDEAGIVFIGPTADAIEAMGDKITARRTVTKRNVPVVPGAELPEDPSDEQIRATADGVGFPVMVKATAGGGGKGMRLVREPDEVVDAVKRAASEARTAFGNGVVYIERFVEQPRHVEIQVLVDDHGNAVALGERECSVQRRHQKVIEETPSPVVTPAMRAEMEQAAVEAARSCDYRGAGTVEFLVGADGGFYFLEMNTRVQVEHPITEMRYRVDIVQEQLRVAQGLPLSFGSQVPEPMGHSIEARICAEDADQNFMPSTGTLGAIQLPGGSGVRCDGHVFVGQEIALHYDNLLLKLIVHADDRRAAIARLIRALYELRLPGITTNVPLILRTLEDPAFVSGNYDTSILEHVRPPDDQPEDLVPVVAAALALYRRSPKRDIPEASAKPTVSAWQQAFQPRGRCM